MKKSLAVLQKGKLLRDLGSTGIAGLQVFCRTPDLAGQGSWHFAGQGDRHFAGHLILQDKVAGIMQDKEAGILHDTCCRTRRWAFCRATR